MSEPEDLPSKTAEAPVIVLTDASRLPNDKRCPNCQAAPIRRIEVSGGFGGDVRFGCSRCGFEPWEIR